MDHVVSPLLPSGNKIMRFKDTIFIELGDELLFSSTKKSKGSTT